MSIVLAEILEWAQDKLAYWEQLALDKIIAKQSLTFDDHNECLEYLLQDKDLRPKTEQRPKINFLQNIPTENNSANKSVHLQGISKVRNVNALVGNQHITFDKKLTVIYGKNGSGKSGYARIIGRAGFTRGDQEILRDVLANPDETATPYAQIELVDNTGQQSILEFTGDAIPAMSSFYMFDSAAIEAHLKNQNELSFSPTGLMYLKFLVEETDAIRNLLAQEIDRHKAYTPPQINWDGKTSVSDLLQSLNAQTKLDEIRSLADLTDEEQEQIVRLEQQIADIENQDSRLIINTKEQGLTDIKNLQQNHISQIMSALAESTISTLNQLIEEYHQISETISQYQLNDLKHPQLHKTGTDEWRTFADAAHKLAQTERIDYPQTGDVCLLCHQPLNLEAQKLVERLWGFLQTGAQAEYKKVVNKLRIHVQSLEQIDLNFFDEESIYYRYLNQSHPEVSKQIQDFVQKTEIYRQSIITAIQNKALIVIQDIPEVSASLDSIIASLNNELNKLRSDEGTKQLLAELKNQQLQLKHRRLLGQHLPQVEKYVETRQWIKKAEKVGGNTQKITKKHNDLFEKHVTDRFLKIFEAKLNELGRPLHVQVEYRGKKGQTFKQITLKSSMEDTKLNTKPDQVLSEGEKRAVAFADFMTEVALDPNCTGIILDDPVTSLDLEWREVIAEILIEQVNHRQVIVFTHDSPFLYLIKNVAEQNSLEYAIHWVTRGSSDGKPGYIYLNNAPVLEKDYKNAEKAEDFYKRAKEEQRPDKHEEFLRSGMNALRTSYEALVIFKLFNEVVQRYSDRISVGRLKAIVWNEELVVQIVETFERLSRYIDGHLHPDNSPHAPMTIELLREEIDEFNNLRGKINKKK